MLLGFSGEEARRREDDRSPSPGKRQGDEKGDERDEREEERGGRRGDERRRDKRERGVGCRPQSRQRLWDCRGNFKL